MPSDWQETTLGDLLTLQRGFDLPTQERMGGPVPIVSSSGISGTHNEARVRAPGVVTGRYGTIGQVFYLETDFWPLNTTLYVKDFKGNEPRFISYLLQRIDFASCSDKSSVPGVNRNDLHLIEVMKPPRSEQIAIAEVLGALDDRIASNRRMNETLEAIACAIFKSWFVDFDPVRAKAEGRQPFGMSAEIAREFPAALSSSPIRPVPRGWEIGAITSRARLLSGGTPKTSRDDYWDGDVLWCSAKDVSQAKDAVLLATERTITTRGLRESATQLIPAWCTVVVARGATTGRLVLLGHEMAMNQTCYALQSKVGTPLALYCLLRSEIANLVHAAHGSVFDTITTTTFDTSLVGLPPKSLLLAFESVVKPFFDLILSNVNGCRTLVLLRETLLPKLLSGEIRLRDAEKTVGAVV